MKRFFSVMVFSVVLAFAALASAYGSEGTPNDVLAVRRCSDFAVNGKGDNRQWDSVEWTALVKLDSKGADYATRFKIMYSAKGIYVLFAGDDSKITSPFTRDFDKIFKGDVFEVFFQPNPAVPAYFEYEVTPLARELVLLLVQDEDGIRSWAPWPYERDKVSKKVTVSGGPQRDGASISSWTAELFFPYGILSPLKGVPPAKGAQWRANFCRLDYDSGSMVKWAWAPIDTSFHELERYYTLIFQ